MVEQSHDHLDGVFRALADPTRREMLRRLTAGELTVSELSAPFDMSLAAASKHVKVLERVGLVHREVRGREHHCRLDPRALADAHEWLAFYEQFWNLRLDALEALLRRRGDEEQVNDMNDKATALTLVRTFAAPVEEVFKAWTDPRLMEEWMAPGEVTVTGIEIDARAGGRYRIALEEAGVTHVTGGTYMEVIPNRRIVKTWRWEGSDVETLVTVDFRWKHGSHTEITLTHERFVNAEMRDRHIKGWEACLAQLDTRYA